MIKNIRHTGIVVRNLKESLAFYQDLLGFKVAKRSEEKSDYIDHVLKLEGASVEIVKLTEPSGQMIELLLFKSPEFNSTHTQKINEVGLTHLAFSVDDVDKAYDLLLQSGIKFNSPPQISPDGFAKVVFCQAPEGTFVELVEEL